MAQYRLQWGGSLYGYDEWSNTLNMVSGTPTGATASDFVAPISSFIEDTTINFTNDVVLTYVKFNQIDAQGKYVDPVTDVAINDAPGFATGPGEVNVPPQLTVVASLLTGYSRGRAHRGRIYLPPNMNTLGDDGMMSSTRTSDLATHVATFLGALNAVDSDLAVHVWSKVGGISRIVTQVAVGGVIDTQRRRRNELTEVYSTVDV